MNLHCHNTAFKGNHDGPHLDRIDSTKGYTKDNVQWLQGWVNNMKGDSSMVQFTDQVTLLHYNLVHLVHLVHHPPRVSSTQGLLHQGF